MIFGPTDLNTNYLEEIINDLNDLLTDYNDLRRQRHFDTERT